MYWPYLRGGFSIRRAVIRFNHNQAKKTAVEICADYMLISANEHFRRLCFSTHFNYPVLTIPLYLSKKQLINYNNRWHIYPVCYNLLKTCFHLFHG